MRKRFVQEPAVGVVHTVEQIFAHREKSAPETLPLRRGRRQLQQVRAEHRHERHGHEQRHQQREDHDDRQLAEEDARNAGEEQQRHEHRDVRQDRRDDRRPHFFAAFDGGGHAILAVFHVPERVFQHDDRGVDHHAYAERQPAERHHVQREPGEVEQGERADHRDGNRRADNERRAEAAEEREDDERDEQRAEHRVFLHGADRAPDVHRAVVEHGQLDVRHLAVDPGDLGFDGFGDLDRVGAGLLLHLHPDAGFAVDAQQRANVFGGVLDVGDVAQINGHTVSRHEHEIADFVEVLELCLAPEQIHPFALGDFAERCVFVLCAQQRVDSLHRKVERRDFLFREIDVNLAAQAAAGSDRCDAVHPFEARAELVFCDFAKRDAIVVPFDAEAHDGLRVGILAENGERLGLERQAPTHAIEARPKIVHRLVEVRAPSERQPDQARALLRRRVHLLEPCDGAHRLFYGTRENLLDLLRPDARVSHANGDSGVGHVRQEVDRQTRQGNPAQQDDDRADHEHRDGASYCRCGNAHARPQLTKSHITRSPDYCPRPPRPRRPSPAGGAAPAPPSRCPWNLMPGSFP